MGGAGCGDGRIEGDGAPGGLCMYGGPACGEPCGVPCEVPVPWAAMLMWSGTGWLRARSLYAIIWARNCVSWGGLRRDGFVPLVPGAPVPSAPGGALPADPLGGGPPPPGPPPLL